MLYSKYISEIQKLAIIDNDDTGHSYLDPSYKVILIDAGLTPDEVTDYKIDWADVREILELEVQRREKEFDNSRNVIDWIYSIITTTVDPVMINEENELMKNMMDYMKLNHELNEREAEVERKEEIQEQKTNIRELVPGMNFSKRGTN